MFIPILNEVMAATCVIDQEDCEFTYDDGDAFIVHSVFEAIRKKNMARILENTIFYAAFQEFLASVE